MISHSSDLAATCTGFSVVLMAQYRSIVLSESPETQVTSQGFMYQLEISITWGYIVQQCWLMCNAIWMSGDNATPISSTACFVRTTQVKFSRDYIVWWTAVQRIVSAYHARLSRCCVVPNAKMCACAVNLQIHSCLMVLWASLHTTKAGGTHGCPVAGCRGCGTTEISCDSAGLTSFPQFPVEDQQMVEELWEISPRLYNWCSIHLSMHTVHWTTTVFQHLMPLYWRTTQAWLYCKSYMLYLAGLKSCAWLAKPHFCLTGESVYYSSKAIVKLS